MRYNKNSTKREARKCLRKKKRRFQVNNLVDLHEGERDPTLVEWKKGKHQQK